MLEEDDVNQSFSGYYGSLFHGTCRPLTRLPLSLIHRFLARQQKNNIFQRERRAGLKKDLIEG
jgi:hypothetical protein